MTVQINQASSPNLPLDWADDIHLTRGGTYGGQVNPGATLSPPVNLTITYTTGLLAVGGALTFLNFFGVLTGSAGFAISMTMVDLSLSGSTTPDTNLTGATLLTLALSNVNLTVGVSGVGLAITSGNLGIAAIMPPESSGDTGSWIAVDATGLAATFNLGSRVTASVSCVNVQINQSSVMDAQMNPVGVVDWTKDVLQQQSGPPITYTTYSVNPGSLLPGASPTNLAITYTAAMGAFTTVSGSLTNLNVFNLITGSADFAISMSMINLPLGDGTSDLMNATLVTVALTDMSFLVGTGSFGLSLSGVSLGLAAIMPGPIPSGTQATDNRFWVAVEGSIPSITPDLGPNITASASNVMIEINQASGAYSAGGSTTPATALNWSQFNSGAGISPGGGLPNITFANAFLQVQASVVLEISSSPAMPAYVYVSGNFSFTKTGPISVNPAGGGAPIQVNALEIGASNVYVFVGTGGPYWKPDGLLASTSGGALGVALPSTDGSPISFGFALLTPTAGGPTYYALEASGSAQLVGVQVDGKALTLMGSINVEVNGVEANGSASAATPVIDFSQLPGNSLSIPTGPTTSPINIGYSSSLLEASGSVTLGIASFAYISGDFAFLQGSNQMVTLANNTTEMVSTLEIGVSNVYAFAGVNGPYWMMNDDGSIRAPPSSAAMGVALSQAGFALALLKPVTTSGTPSTISYLALQATGSVALVGVPNLTLSANNLSIEVNQVSDSNSSDPANWPINLTASDITVPVDSNPADNIPLNFASGSFLEAQGTVSITISQFVSITGSVAFTQSTAKTLTLSDGTTIASASVLTVGASHVYAFAGVGGPYWMTGPGGSIEAPLDSSAVGVALANVSFGLALLEAPGGSPSFYALKATADGISLVGVPGVTLSAKNLTLDVNGTSASGGPVVNFAASYPASSGNSQAGLTVSTGPGTPVLLNDATSVLSASGNVMLDVSFAGQPALTLSANVTFEDTKDPSSNSQAIALVLSGFDVSFGGLFNIKNASGVFLLTGSTLAGEIILPDFSFSNSTVSFTGTITLEFNNGPNAVDTTFDFTEQTTGMPGSDMLNVPAGPFVLVAANNLNLMIDDPTKGNSPVTFTGNVQIEDVSVPSTSGAAASSEVRIALYGVGFSEQSPTYGSFTLTNGQGVLILLSGGVAGQFSGKLDFTMGGPTGSGTVYFNINTTDTIVVQTVPLAEGGSLSVNVAGNMWQLQIANASITIGNPAIVTLTGNFSVTSEPGMTLYGASNVTLFLGVGPPTVNGAANTNAIGVEVTDASIGVVAINGTYAVFAYGQAALVGLSPLSVSGSLAVWYNDTRESLNVSVPLPPGSTQSSVPVTFQSAQNVEEFAAGYNDVGTVNLKQFLTISASQVFTIQGAVQFTESPTGQVAVDVPNATVSIKIPDSSGNFPSTPTFSISGSAQFMIGGASGFQLQSLQVNGFSIFGAGATIQNPAAALLPLTATLVSPGDGSMVDVDTLNQDGYIQVHYNDYNGFPINVTSILTGAGQFTLSGAAAANVVVNSRPTQVNPDDDSDFDYSFTGSFVVPSSDSPTVMVEFTPGSYGDMAGATNLTQYASFTLFNSATQQSTQTISLSGNPSGGTFVLGVSRPDTGAAGTISIPFGSTTSQVQSLFDAFFGAGNTTVTVANNDSFSVLFTGTLAGQTMPVFTVNSDGLTGGTTPGVGVTGNNAPATASLASPINGSSVNTQSMDQRGYIDVTFNVPGGDMVVDDSALTGVVSLSGTAANNIQPLLGAPKLVSGDTYRYSLTPASGVAMNQMFSDGVVVVNFSATTLTVQVPQGAGSTGTAMVTVPLQASTESFTVSGSSSDEASSTTGIKLGPLMLSGPSLGLAGESFSGGTLDLSVAIGVASASLNFGSGQSGSGITASLTNVLGTFHVQVNVFSLLSAITSGSAKSILGAFSVPANFSLNIGGLNITVPNAVTIMASGIQFNYNPSFNPDAKPSNYDMAAMHGSDGLYHQEYLVIDSGSVYLPAVGVTAKIMPDTAANPGLTIWDNGFTVGTATLSVTGSNGAPITLGSILSFNNIAVSVSDFDVVFGQAINFNGSVSISSTGATFLPGKPISASITASTPGQPAIEATLQFSGGKVSDVMFSVPGTFSVSISSYVTFTGTGITLDTSAGPTQPIVTIDSIGVKVALGSIAITGSATDFEFLGNGSFMTLPGFGVVLSVGSSTGGSFMWPSWLPIQITELGIQWPDITTDPTDMLITLSANVTGIQGLGGLTFSGSVTGVQIDTGLLLEGKFPIVGIQGFGVSVTGDMFGGQIDATLVGGIVKLNANGNMIAATDTTTPVAARVFYAGLQGGFSFGGLSGFTIQVGLSSLGPLGVQLSVNLPEGILLDPTTGLSLNDFTAGVKFFSTLPSITDPMQLNGAAFTVQSVPVASDWLSMIQTQVVAQYKAIQANPNLGGFLAAFTSPMTIIGSADIYSIYTSQQLFNGQVTVEISTDGKFMVAGKLNFAGNKISISGKLYADLSKVASGDVTVLFLANIPDQVQLLTLDGSLKMGFENAQAQQVTFQTTAPALPEPSAQLVGPVNNGSIGYGTVNGEGYVDVTFPSSPYPTGSGTSFSGTLNAGSVNSMAPAIKIKDPNNCNLALDTSQAPLEMSDLEYRYWLTGVTQSESGMSDLANDITFIQGRVSYSDASGNIIFNQYGVDVSTTNPSATAMPEYATTFNVVYGSYVDVRLYPSVGARARHDRHDEARGRGTGHRAGRVGKPGHRHPQPAGRRHDRALLSEPGYHVLRGPVHRHG